MGKTIPVSPAQVAGAQFLVKQAELGGPAVAQSVRKLAAAKHGHTQRTDRRDRRMLNLSELAQQRGDAATEAARLMDEAKIELVTLAEQADAVRAWAEEHGVVVHDVKEGILLGSGGSDSNPIVTQIP